MELPWAKSCWAPGEVWSRQPAGGRPCAAPCCAAGSVALGSWISAEAWACFLWRREEGLAYSPSCMKTAVHPLKPKGDTETNKHPKPQPAVRPELGTWIFLGEGLILYLQGSWSHCSFLGHGSRSKGCQAAGLLPSWPRFTMSVLLWKPDKAQGMDAQPLHPSTGCFPFFFFFFFFFSLASSYVAMFDRSDLLSCNEPLGEKGQMQLPLATSLAAGRWTLPLCLGFNKCPSVYLSANVFPFHFQIGTNPVCWIRNFPSLTKVEGKKKSCKVQEEGRGKNENKMNRQEPVSAFFL